MIEWQCEQMLRGFKEIYKRAQAGQHWTGDGLELGKNGIPLVHYILEDLNVPSVRPDEPTDVFYDDPHKMRQALIDEGHGFDQPQRHRSHSVSSDSDNSAHHDSVRTPSDIQVTPCEAKPLFNNSDFDLYAAQSRPSTQSPGLPQPGQFLNLRTPSHNSQRSFEQPIEQPWRLPENEQSSALYAGQRVPVTMLRSNRVMEEAQNAGLLPGGMASLESQGPWTPEATSMPMSVQEGVPAYLQQPPGHYDESGMWVPFGFDHNASINMNDFMLEGLMA